MNSLGSKKQVGRILFIGVSYYNNWYLSRELRKLGWKADVLAYSSENSALYSHGSDFFLKEYTQNDPPKKWFALLHSFFVGDLDYLESLLNKRLKRFASSLGRISSWFVRHAPRPVLLRLLMLFLNSMRTSRLAELEPLYDVLTQYDIVHFTGVQNLRYFYFFSVQHFGSMPIGWDVELLKRLGKKIVYSNTGCLDGVSQSSFRKWEGPEVVCDICPWRDNPDVCSDEHNLTWGKLRNELCDYQITLGGNRGDYNDDPRVHEVPEFYCLDPEVWQPDLSVPAEYRLEFPQGTVKIFHAVGNFKLRTDENNRNLKSTHIYLPLIERLKQEGYPVELLFFSKMPNKELRFYQVQADIFVDMLTVGFFGATAREGMMLGKPVICYLRPQWLEQMRREIPEYVDELPIVSATPQTVEKVLKDLIEQPEKRAEIGKRSRAFALKWHSAEAGAKRLEQIYSSLLKKRW